MNEIAVRRNDYEPIDKPHLIKLSLVFTKEEYQKLIRGHIPYQMEDKWYIFYEDDWLYFHRSWTGYGMYKAQVLPDQNGYYIDEFWAERRKEMNKYGDDYNDSWEFLMLVSYYLLGINTRVYLQEQNQRQNKIILE